jgi:hypothetical protein
LDLANFGSSAPQKMSTATPVVGGNKLRFDDDKFIVAELGAGFDSSLDISLAQAAAVRRCAPDPRRKTREALQRLFRHRRSQQRPECRPCRPGAP